MDNLKTKQEKIKISIDGKNYEISEGDYSGEDILAIAGKNSASFLLSRITAESGVPDASIAPEELLNVSEPENRKFNTVSKTRLYTFKADEQSFESAEQFVTGGYLLSLLGLSPATHDITFQILGKPDTYIGPDETADLALPGREQFFSVEKRPLTITIDATSYSPGKTHMTGAELRSLPSPPLPNGTELWFDVPGKEDVLIGSDEALDLVDGMAFYTKAASTFILTISVSGVSVDIKVKPTAPLREAAYEALKETGNLEGRPVEEWELKDLAGTKLDMGRSAADYSFASGTKLYLSPEIGAGGAYDC